MSPLPNRFPIFRLGDVESLPTMTARGLGDAIS